MLTHDADTMSEFTEEYDTKGRRISYTYGNYPENPWSWRDEYDAEDRWIARTFGDDPKRPESWRKA